MMRQWAQFGSPGVCQVPGLAFVASRQQAIREFRVWLMELKQTPASCAAENRDSFLQRKLAVQFNRGIQRQAPKLGFPTSLSSSFSSLSSI